ncbi:hypothetical protein DPMN_080599 [Dreissena polymorpha]|uniref:Uncharacterized protein n=1 Tax=Dreissena polymorpha TaxID=45954 RepID=A0A9D3YWQ3_DREPO|nr:hypothetical protein DPMN_080599 [Dreissena polymorpha]
MTGIWNQGDSGLEEIFYALFYMGKNGTGQFVWFREDSGIERIRFRGFPLY